MDFLPISDYDIFHSLLEPYYREGAGFRNS